MVAIDRVKVELSGSAVTGPGVSIFYTTGGGPVLANALQTLYNSLKNVMPVGLQINVQNGGETYESTTGAPLGVWSGGAVSGLLGAASGGYAQGVGARIVWSTGGVTNNRRVRGSTYIVPLSATYYSSDGTIDNTWRTGAGKTAVDAFRTTMGGDLVIWTRPKGGAGGGLNSTTAGNIDDRVSWLRSRRS